MELPPLGYDLAPCPYLVRVLGRHGVCRKGGRQGSLLEVQL